MTTPDAVPERAAPDAVAAPAGEPRRVVFVGGSGRSGTTPTSRLLGQHSKLAMVPAELRIHVRRRGLGDLADGRSDLDFFLDQMRGRWYRRPHEGLLEARDEVGLHEIVESEEVLDSLLDTFAATYDDDPDEAARGLMCGLLDPVATAAGADTWVEHSPENVTIAPTLYRLFPNLKFVHSMRDGRDVASSMTRVPWGPDNLIEAIRWWGRRLRLAHRQTGELPDDRVHILHLEDLVTNDREGAYTGLLEFLELDDEPSLREYFDDNIQPDRAHIGRWKEDVAPEEHAEVDAVYDSVLESLRADGVSIPVTARDRPRPAEGADRELAIAQQRMYELHASRAELAAEYEEAQERYEKELGRAQTSEEQLRVKLDRSQELLDELRERNRQQLDRMKLQVERTRSKVEKVALLRNRAKEAKQQAQRRANDAEARAESLERELELMREELS